MRFTHWPEELLFSGHVGHRGVGPVFFVRAGPVAGLRVSFLADTKGKSGKDRWDHGFSLEKLYIY